MVVVILVVVVVAFVVVVTFVVVVVGFVVVVVEVVEVVLSVFCIVVFLLVLLIAFAEILVSSVPKESFSTSSKKQPDIEHNRASDSNNATILCKTFIVFLIPPLISIIILLYWF